MKKNIGSDVNYNSEILRHIFKCKICGSPLLMFGCNNPECENYNTKRILEDNERDRKRKDLLQDNSENCSELTTKNII